MPIYEYQCTSCHHQFELMQKVSDAPAKQCPVCFEDKVIKLVSAAGFQLKGTGWYVTDFKNKNKPENKAQGGKSEAQQDNSSREDKKQTEAKSTESAKSTTSKGEKD